MLPDRIGRYEVRSLAGAGGFATVYEGFDPRLDAVVAIKVLAENWSSNPGVRRRFRQEAVLLRRLRVEQGVPGLIEVFDIDETEAGQPFFIMGWADRGTLAERLGDVPWQPAEVAPIIASLTESLGHLHAASVVHRDIKPQNLLIRGDHVAGPRRTGGLANGERVFVSDLGLAKDLSNASSSVSMVGGTERYMAPEQLRVDTPVDHRADIYAASMLIERLLRGPGRDAPITPALEQAIAKGASFDRGDRHNDMAEWRNDLLAAIRTPPSDPAPIVAEGPAGSNTDAAATDLSDVPAPAPPATEHNQPLVSSPDPSPATSRRPLLAGLALGVVAVLGGIVWITLGSNSRIVGPDELVSGQVATFSLEGAESGDVTWQEPSGALIRADELEVIGRLPGLLSFSATADGERFERSVTVVSSPDGPRIVGPDSLAIGEQGTYSAAIPAGHTFYWIHPTQGTVVSASLTVEQVTGVVIVGVVSVDADGVERGEQLLIGLP